MDYWRGKVAVITGGSAGFGKAMASALARAHARVVLAARDPQRLEETVSTLVAAGGDVVGIPTDVTDDQQVTELIANTHERFQRIDFLVNNAGKSTRGNVSETPVAEFDQLLQLNFLAAVRCTRAALPHLIASQGHVVQIASLAAKAATRYLGAYPASKAPLTVYSQQLRLEVDAHGVHVLLVCPGPIARDDAGHRYDDQSGDLPPAARRPGGGVRLHGVEPDRLARLVMRACQRRSPELIVPAKAKLLLALSALWPSLGDKILQRMTD
jgi:short-subunit dehydrogenase